MLIVFVVGRPSIRDDHFRQVADEVSRRTRLVGTEAPRGSSTRSFAASGQGDRHCSSVSCVVKILPVGGDGVYSQTFI